MKFLPPYSGFLNGFRNHSWFKDDETDFIYFYQGGATKNGSPDFVWSTEAGTVEPKTGHIVISKTIGVEDASDDDQFVIGGNASILQWFQAIPDPGRIQIKPLIKINSVCGHNGYVHNEDGVSNLLLEQRLRMYARIVATFGRIFPRGGPRPPLNLSGPFVTWDIFHHVDTNQESHTWNNDAWQNGWAPGRQTYLTEQLLPGSFAEGTSVLVEIGILFENRFFSDDCELRSGVTAAVDVLELDLQALPFA
jgi:hypothetical protein